MAVATLIAKASAEWRAIHAVADRLAPVLRRALLMAIERVRLRLPLSMIAEAFARNDLDVLRRIGLWDDLDAELRAALRPVLEQTVLGGGDATVQRFPESVTVQMQFDLTNLQAVAAVDQQVAAIVRDLVNVDAAGILNVLRQGFLQGIPPAAMARQLRQYLGLTPQYSQAVARLRTGLAEQNVAPGKIDAQAEAYAERLRRQRATTIARTETIRAANIGQQLAWTQARDQQLLDPAMVRRKWIITPDDRLCPICEAIPDYNPGGVGLEEPFQSDVGSLMTPPAHPQCRCAIALDVGTP